jgi:hypothetical protein
MLRLAPIAAVLALWFVVPAQAQLAGIAGDETAATTNYTGPCNVLSGGCAAAFSVDRAMTASYSGNLFQLIRASDNTTLNVAQTAGHVVNTAPIASFCNKTYCYYNLIYDQIGSSNLIPVGSHSGTAAPSYCSSTTPCVTPFWFDPETGLPIVRTGGTTSQFDNETADSNIIGGSHAISVYSYGSNQGWSICCGSFGVAHEPYNSDTVGTMFSEWLDYGNASTTYQSCSSSTTICAGIDEESANLDGANYTPTASQDLQQMITWDGAAATNTVTVYVNSATPIYSNSPPCAERNGCPANAGGTAAFNIQTTLRLGGGGDNSHVDQIFREGLIANTALSGSDFTNLSNNETAFFSPYNMPAVCEGIGDFSLPASFNGSQNEPAGIGGTLGAYGLYRMRASYWGPVVTLRDNVTNVEATYGPASSGCGLDPAAASTCATDGCSVVTLYNQATYDDTTAAGSSAHNANMDLTQQTNAAQPTVTFNSLNGLATLHFSGAQMLCSGAITDNPPPAVWAETVARRTGNTSSAAVVFSGNNAGGNWFGWQSASNTPGGYFGGNFSSSKTVTDGTWLSEIVDLLSSSTKTLYVGGVNGSNAIGVDNFGLGTSVCLGAVNNASFYQYLTGDVAELAFGTAYAMNPSFYNDPEAIIFSLQKTVWGTLD